MIDLQSAMKPYGRIDLFTDDPSSGLMDDELKAELESRRAGVIRRYRELGYVAEVSIFGFEQPTTRVREYFAVVQLVAEV